MSSIDWDKAAGELTKPLSGAAVKERTQAGRTLSYVEGWHVIAEANRIFGFQSWTRETMEMKETHRELVTVSGQKGTYQQWRVSYLAKVRVTIDGIVREGTGYGSGMGKPEALGDAIESAAKEAETDAMKRAFMTFGNPFGLALYDKTQANVTYEQEQEPAPAKPDPQLLKRDEARKLYKQLEAELVSLRKPAEVQQWEKARELEIAKLGDWKSYIDKAIESHVIFVTKRVFEAAE